MATIDSDKLFLVTGEVVKSQLLGDQTTEDVVRLVIADDAQSAMDKVEQYFDDQSDPSTTSVVFNAKEATKAIE